MSYTVRLRVIQTEPAKWFNIVEKTVWHDGKGGTWAESDGEHTLTMGGSDTSGTLRFKNPLGEYFLVALGDNNHRHWCHIVSDLGDSSTGVLLNSEYYGDGKFSDEPPKQNTGFAVKTSQGASITVKYYKEDKHTWYATITIKYSLGWRVLPSGV